MTAFDNCTAPVYSDDMPKERTFQTAFRLPEDLVKRIDAHVLYMEQGHPGVSFTRVDAVRSLLTSALDAIDAKEASRQPATPRRKA